MSEREQIRRIHAREVLDSRGNPTVEVEVHCVGGSGRAIVPSGASTGRHEAVELRDRDVARYAGKGVRVAVANVREQIAPRLVGRPVTDQAGIDRLMCELDGTADKARLGANAILGVSLACAHAAVAIRNEPLWRYLSARPGPRMPVPMVNMISGGLHAGGNLDVQDVLFIPVAARSYSEALEQAVAVYHGLSAVLRSRGLEGVLVGDEGGFGPRLANNEQAIEMLLEAFRGTGLAPGSQAALAVDAAATHFWSPAGYRWQGKLLSTDDMIAVWQRWVRDYPVVSIEDGLAEDDWTGWQRLTAVLGECVQLIGDDLFVTNPRRLERGITEKVANSILIKINQIGTLTETLEVLEQARSAGYRPVISARSGETEDSSIADLAVATGAGQIKIGSVARGERLAKYNQLTRIEEELGAEHFARWRPVGT